MSNLLDRQIHQQQLIQNRESKILSEYKDILPSYSDYVKHKRNYQLHKISIESVDDAFKLLLSEIYEFLDILYISTENTQERAEITLLLNKFIDKHN